LKKIKRTKINGAEEKGKKGKRKNFSLAKKKGAGWAEFGGLSRHL
jgi:hypothetical protein